MPAPERRPLGHRIRSAPVARAMFSPSAILLAGGAASAAILAGLWPLAPVAAAVGWLGRVALAVPKRDRSGDVRPGSLAEPWRGFVLDAQRAAQRFDEQVALVQAGPLRDELQQVAGRVHEGVRDCFEVARRGMALDRARASLQLGEATAELHRLHGERELRARQRMPVDTIDAAIVAVHRQLEAGRRVEETAFATRDRLRALNAQLDEAVAAAVEVAVRPGAGAGAVSTRVEGVVGQLDALREALDEAEGLATPSPGSLA